MTFVVTAGAAAKAWLVTLAMMAGQGTLLALVAFALARAGKLRPAWQAAIWLVVMIKLALPWGPAMPFSLSDLIAMFHDHATSAPPIVVGTPGHTIAAAPQAWPAVGWIALAIIWMLGAAWVVGRAVLAQRATTRAARMAPLAPPHALALLGELSARVRVRVPHLAIGEADIGPHVVGVLRPIVVVPPGLVDDAGLLRAALLHELAHIRRRDVLARFIQIAAGALLWWWPVVRIVNRRLEAAREAACDAWALETSDVPRAAYARLLVRMASLRAGGVAAPALAAHHALDARVAAVLGPPVRARLGWLGRSVLAGWALVALGGARSASARGHVEACHYTPALAATLYAAYPQADLDGDGQLSRAEACDLQVELRRDRQELTTRLSPEAEEELQSLLSEPLCCNSPGPEVYSNPESVSCQNVLGVEP